MKGLELRIHDFRKEVDASNPGASPIEVQKLVLIFDFTPLDDSDEATQTDLCFKGISLLFPYNVYQFMTCETIDLNKANKKFINEGA